MKVFVQDCSALIESAVSGILKIINDYPEAVIAFSPEPELMPLYDRLIEMAEDGKFSLKKIRALITFDVSDGRGARHLYNDVFSKLEICNSNIYILSELNADEYDELIYNLGGITLTITGIGSKGQLALNDVGSFFSSVSRKLRITEALKNELYLQNCHEGVSMGIKTIISSKNIVAFVTDEGKTKAVFDTLYSRNDGCVPSAYLQIPADVYMYVSEKAAAKI